MILTDARALVRRAARNAGDSTAYSDAQIDDSIKHVCSRFCRITRCLPKLSGVALAASTALVDATLLATATGAAGRFRPERLMSAYIDAVAEPLELIAWEDIRRLEVNQPGDGTPTALAWADQTTAHVWPTPPAITTLYLRWWQPFDSTVASGGSGAGTLNLPDDYLAEILPDGVPAMLQGKEPEHKYATAAWQRYLAFEQSMMGAGNLAARVVGREMQE